jgi:hypothetical protein
VGDALLFQGSSVVNALTIQTVAGTNNSNIAGANDLSIQGADVLISAFSDLTLAATANVSVSSGAGDPTTIGGFPINLNPQSNGFVHIGSGSTTGFLCIQEAASSVPTVAAGDGMFWVSDDSPNMPRFTDDTNVDYQLQNALVAQSTAASVSAATTVLATTPTYTAAANTLVAGAVFHIKYSYLFVRGATATALNLSSFFDVATFPSTTVVGPTTAGSYIVTVEAMLTILTTGAGGTAMGWIRTTVGNTAASADDIASNGSVSFAVNTTASLAMRGAAAMSAGVAATSITALGGFIQKLK